MSLLLLLRVAIICIGLLNCCFVAQSQTFPQKSLQVCDLIVDAGPDTNVCYPGGTIQLMGSIIGNDVFFSWSPTAGLNNPLILNPVANVTGPVIYTLTAFAEDPDNPNLVSNGDFSERFADATW